MDERIAIEVLAGLAQEHRLRVFRLLMREGPGGLPAGQIAERLDIPPSTLSAHLAQLERTGLLRSRRDQRRIIYAVDLDGIRRLLAFLIEDCCQGRPELCGYGLGGGWRDDHYRPIGTAEPRAHRAPAADGTGRRKPFAKGTGLG